MLLRLLLPGLGGWWEGGVLGGGRELPPVIPLGDRLGTQRSLSDCLLGGCWAQSAAEAAMAHLHAKSGDATHGENRGHIKEDYYAIAST